MKQFLILILIFFNAALMKAEDFIKISKSPYGEKVTLENRFLSASFYPEWGGRMCELIDRKSGTNTVFWDYPPDHPKWGQGWGGALDDRVAWHAPYKLELLKESAEECQIALTSQPENGKIKIKKVITLKSDRPSLLVTYHFSNLGQKPTEGYEVAIRNFIYPSGKPHNWEYEKAIVPTTKTIRVLAQNTRNAPEINSKFCTEIMPTWNAFVNQQTNLGIGFSFQDDLYRWFYRWIGGESSTYELVFSPISEGKEAVTTFTIALIHGMSRYVDITADYAANIELSGERGAMAVNYQIYALDHGLRNVLIKSELRDLSGKKVELPEIVLGTVEAGALKELKTNWNLSSDPDLILSQAVFEDGKKIGEYEIPVNIDQPPNSYIRPKKGKGSPVFKDIPGWKKVVEEVIQPMENDRERGYLVYQDKFAKDEKNRKILLKGIDLDVGRNEFESLAFDVLAFKDLEEMTVSVDNPNINLRLEEIVPIPEAIKAGKPEAKCHKLTETRRFNLSKGQKQSIWLTWDGRKIKPGKYTAKISITAKNAPAYDFPVNILVYDVLVPERNIFDFELGGGDVFGFLAKINNNDLGKTKAYLKDLGMHRCGVASIFDSAEFKGIPIIPAEEFKDRSTGKPIKSGDINEETVLDLSWCDPWIQSLIDNGLIRICSRQSGLKPRSPAQKGIMREIARYMAEKGYPYRDRFVKFVDEQPPEFFPAMAETGEMYHKLGWRVLNTSSPMESSVQMKILNQSTDFWHGAIPEKKTIADRRREGALDEKDEIWTYDGWGAVWMPYESRRIMAWNCVAHDLDGMHLHVYHRGNPMENIIELSPEGPISSPAWEGARDGIEDVQYYRLARQVLENLKSNGINNASLKDYEKKLDKIKEEALNQPEAEITIASLQKARKECLDILTALKPYQDKIKPSVFYGFTPLMANGAVNFKLFGSKEAATILSGALMEKTGGEIVFSGNCPELIGTVKENAIMTVERLSPICADLAKKKMIPMTDAYPAKNSYAVWEIPNPDCPGKWLLLIVGGDSAGLQQGCRNFIKFLRFTPARF